VITPTPDVFSTTSFLTVEPYGNVTTSTSTSLRVVGPSPSSTPSTSNPNLQNDAIRQTPANLLLMAMTISLLLIAASVA